MEQELARCGYAFVRAAAMREALEENGPLTDWDAFAASWNDLHIDEYLAEGQRFRRRGFAVYAIDSTRTIDRQPHQPHYQHPEYNALFGGVERWFAPVAAEIGGGPTMLAILRFCDRLFHARMPSA